MRPPEARRRVLPEPGVAEPFFLSRDEGLVAWLAAAADGQREVRHPPGLPEAAFGGA